MKPKGPRDRKSGLSRREWLATAAGAGAGAIVAAAPPVSAGPETGNLKLTLACWDYDRTRALQDGRVALDGIDLTYLSLVIEETFFRQARYHEFDVSEMSLSSYVVSLFADDPQFIAIPVFPSRSFRHSGIYINANSGIREPKDLIGKKVACAEYQLTANVWIRGILNDEYKVPITSYTTYRGGLEEPGRIEKISLSLPPNVKVESIPEGKTLSKMLETGELDAMFTPRAPSSFSSGSGKVRRLFANYANAEREYYQRTKIFPIMHVIAMRREVYEKNRWIAQSLYKGFLNARRITYEDMHETAALKYMLPWLVEHVEETEKVMGKDFWQYGFEPNVNNLTTFLRYSYEQGLAKKLLTPKDLFAPETLETFKI
jgi:4,5-dihydroxyphthalate decarboxylase